LTSSFLQEAKAKTANKNNVFLMLISLIIGI